jgi:hypothetical protein
LLHEFSAVFAGGLLEQVVDVVFDGALGERKIWSRIAYLVSNANLWDVSFESKGGKLIFTVSAEQTSHYTGCIFRDDNEIKRIARLLLG